MKISDLKFGDIVTFINNKGNHKTKAIYCGNSRFQSENNAFCSYDYEFKLEQTGIVEVLRYKPTVIDGKVYYIPDIIYIRKEILTDKEKEYLRAVIKPFRDRVKYISKGENDTFEMFYIHINSGFNDTYLPFFKKDTLYYKGMELNKEYSIEDLEL